MTGSGWWAGYSGAGNGAVVGILDWDGGRGEMTAVPKGAKEGVLSGSGRMSRTVDGESSGKSGMFSMLQEL